ncbi:uncharacterized protein LAESUDRAFT_136474 [Laetiporus sulphureus 93-53]|uniref:Uncharacterized protein n=1 Tax=Laetiporus sulphureus 93-53 TaxID=1314785 RepID=A0A165ED51_9APHY|nr:uncharacterized protein LAESUDRAFT_136474 [Laetiporus sulphureus 93-53]KZT06775.1 hypothetical protein LAESUDRAFT_136474 [Laetiporus sulphureus 93-53]
MEEGATRDKDDEEQIESNKKGVEYILVLLLRRFLANWHSLYTCEMKILLRQNITDNEIIQWRAEHIKYHLSKGEVSQVLTFPASPLRGQEFGSRLLSRRWLHGAKPMARPIVAVPYYIHARYYSPTPVAQVAPGPLTSVLRAQIPTPRALSVPWCGAVASRLLDCEQPGTP